MKVDQSPASATVQEEVGNGCLEETNPGQRGEA